MTAFPPASPPSCIISLPDDATVPIVAPYSPSEAWCFLAATDNEYLVVRGIKQPLLLRSLMLSNVIPCLQLLHVHFLLCNFVGRLL